MSVDLDAKLDAIFNAKAERIAEANRVKLETEQKQEENLKAFLALQKSVIRPTLQALFDNLSGRGQESEIVETTDGQKNGNETLAAGTGIKFYSHKLLKNISKSKNPYLNFLLDKVEGKVIIQFSTVAENRKGTFGSAAVDFDVVTADLINEETLKVIAAINGVAINK